MNALGTVRNRIQALYRTHPDIHVNVQIKSPHRMTLNNLPVVIKDVYPHMFQVEYCGEGTARLYTHPYTDLITRDLEILKLPDPAFRNTGTED